MPRRVRIKANKAFVPLLAVTLGLGAAYVASKPEGDKASELRGGGVAAASNIDSWMHANAVSVNLGEVATGCVRKELPTRAMTADDLAALGPGGGSEVDNYGVRTGSKARLSSIGRGVVTMAVGTSSGDPPPTAEVEICAYTERGVGVEVLQELPGAQILVGHPA